MTMGFSIPTGATITGIRLVTGKYETTSGDTVGTFYLAVGGAQQSQCKSQGDIPGTFSTIVYGGPADLWDCGSGPISLTAEQVNATGFGIIDSMVWNDESHPGPSTVYTDYYKITVYYTEEE
jgi:hypothetical protein